MVFRYCVQQTSTFLLLKGGCEGTVLYCGTHKNAKPESNLILKLSHFMDVIAKQNNTLVDWKTQSVSLKLILYNNSIFSKLLKFYIRLYSKLMYLYTLQRT